MSSQKNDLSSIFQTSSIPIKSVVDETVLEPDDSVMFNSAISNASIAIPIENDQYTNEVESVKKMNTPERTVDETIYHSFSEQTIEDELSFDEQTPSEEVEKSIEFLGEQEDILEKTLENEVLESSEYTEDVQSPIMLEQSSNDESFTELEENVCSEETKLVESVTSVASKATFTGIPISSSQTDLDLDLKETLETSSEEDISCELITNNKLVENEYIDRHDVNLLNTKNAGADSDDDANEEIMSEPSREAIISDNNDDENINLASRETDNAKLIQSSLEVMEESEENLDSSENETSDIKIDFNEDAHSNNIVNLQELEMPVTIDHSRITNENNIEKLAVGEITERSAESVNKPKHTISDEEIFEDAMETVEGIQNRTTQEPKSVNEIKMISRPVEISKLEQALTGRLDNFQSHPRTFNPQLTIRKEQESNQYEVQEVPASVRESKPVVEDAKKNIKLHLSVQGDRVSIRNTQLTLDTVSQVRVKRVYRKRIKVPGELEAKKANAKEYANRLRQRTERETPGAKKRGRKKKNQNYSPTEIMLDDESNSNQFDLSEKTVEPLSVAIDRESVSKTNIVGKVQPIKLKISKNANVTIECTSKYDLSSSSEESNKNSMDVNEKIVCILEEARKKDNVACSYMEKATSAWSGPDLQRVERLLKESNVTITPVTGSRDVSPQPTSILKPILSSKEKLHHQTSNIESITGTSVTQLNESNCSSTDLITSLKADVDEQLSPWKIVKSDSDLNSSSFSSSVAIDVKSEIRKKIALIEKRKQEISSAEIEAIPELHPNINKSVADLPITAAVEENSDSGISVRLMDMDSKMGEQVTSEPVSTSTPLIQTTPSAPKLSYSKLSHLPTALFPKKRGRPTKAMVAAREAYRQQQEDMVHQMQTNGEVNLSGEMNVTSTETIILSTEPPPKGKRGRKPKSERMEKKDSDDLSYDELPMDPMREAEQQKRLEEERVKKEEERERKNELRRLKAKERSDLVKAKRLRQKMKAKERHKLAKELRRLQQEEKKKLEEQLKRLPVSMGFDDDTRMSAENSQAANISFSLGMMDDDSSGATNDISQKFKKSRMEVTDSDSKDLMVDQIAEYQWPIQGGELYMIQEQVSNFLGVKSFKRKYPDIWRRPVDSEERAYLVDSGLVSETLCDLGITAVRSAEVLDIMCSDFPEKYEEFRRYMREKQMKELSFKQKAWANGLGYKLLMADGSKQDMKKRAMESASNWNSALNKSRVEDRRCHMDLQTFIIHFPKHRGAKMTMPLPKIGSFPVTILPGQFCDYYKEYTPTELRYMPVNTVLYGPLKHPVAAQNGDGSQTDSDDSSSSDESSTTSEDTQATEETLDDIDKDMSVDDTTIKFVEMDTSFIEDKEQIQQEIMNDSADPLVDNDCSKTLCKVCLGDQFRNKLNVPEVMICCSQCASTSHPTCLDLSLNMAPHIKSYAWQCPDCKICARCKENADEDKMLFCDTCDRGYHIYCVGLKKVPSGNWQCQECTIVESNSCDKKIAIPKESNLIEITS